MSRVNRQFNHFRQSKASQYYQHQQLSRASATTRKADERRVLRIDESLSPTHSWRSTSSPLIHSSHWVSIIVRTVISPESISLKNASQANDDDVGGNETSGNCRKTIFCNFPLCKYFFSLFCNFPIEPQFQSRVPKSSRASIVDHVRSTIRLRYLRL